MNSAADSSTGDNPAGRAPRDVLRTVRDMIPENVRIAISRLLLSRQMQEQLSLRWKTAGISWPDTQAFVIENANEGYIRINLRGREPEGVVEPGEAYTRLCAELARTAETMINPATGQPAALAVHRLEEVSHGPCRDYLPDVVIVWNPDARVTNELWMERYGLVRTEHPGCGVAPFYTGNHWPNAFVAAKGRGIPAGSTFREASILDLAPTILARLGLEIPEHMDGRVLDALALDAAGRQSS